MDVPYLSQEGEYPTACEIVSAVMVLSYYGYDAVSYTHLDVYKRQVLKKAWYVQHCFGPSAYSSPIIDICIVRAQIYRIFFIYANKATY